MTSRTHSMIDLGPPGRLHGAADISRGFGELLARRLLHIHRRVGGERGEVAVVRPSCGVFPAALPGLLRDCGIRILLLDLSPARRPAALPETFFWEGIDGARVLAHCTCAPEEDLPGLLARADSDAELPVLAGEMDFRQSAARDSATPGDQSELLLRDAEFFAAIHPGNAAEYPAATFAAAWESALHTPHFPRESAEAIIDDALGKFEAGIDTADLQCPVAVWNTLSFARSGLVSLPWEDDEEMLAISPHGQVTRTQLTREDGAWRRLVEVVDVPSMGYAVYDLLVMPDGDITWAVEDTARATPTSLENDLVRVEVNGAGEVVSYFDKHLRREIIPEGSAANRLSTADGEALAPSAEVTVEETGPIRATLRVSRTCPQGTRVVQHLRLEANSRRLDCETVVTRQEDSPRLTVAFPVAVHSHRATYEIPFGHVERPIRRQALRAMSGHAWADLSEGDYGVALLNNGRGACDVRGHALRLALPEGADRFTYSLLPHRGSVVNSGVPLAGYDVNVPLRARLLPVREGALAQAHSFFRVDRPNLIIESVKRAEDGDGIIVRLYEAYRRRGTARLVVNGLSARAARTDLCERDLHPLEIHGGTVEFAYRPFEVITIRLR